MKKLFCIFLPFFFLGNSLVAQSELNGVVISSEGEPYIGATILEKGQLNQTLTDENGKFQLTVYSDTLIVSLGFDRLIVVAIGDENELRIVVEEEMLKNAEAPSVTIYNQYIKSENENTTTIPISYLEKMPAGSVPEVLNNIPGLHMQSGGYNTNKLSIRGIGSTSQFATSDVKTFYNNIPLHSSIGESAIEDIGFHMSDRIEIIKGTTGSMHESGFGGAIIIKNKNTKSENSTTLSSTTSFGRWNNVTSQNQIKISRTNNRNAHNISVYHSYITDDGYRENNEFDRNNLTFNYTFNKGGKLKITTLINHVDLKAFIPSSLNREDFLSEPTKAAFTWGTAMGNEDYSRLMAGINLDYQFNHRKSMSHTVYSQSFNSSELRPFNTIDEKSSMIGFKGNYKYINQEGNKVYTVGYRLQAEMYDFELFETEVDTKGQLFENGGERRAIGELFAHFDSEIDEKWSYKLGVNVQYANILIDNNEVYNKAFILPEATLTYRHNHNTRLYLTTGRGINYFNPQEALLPDGSYNDNLLPTSAINLALGSKGLITNHLQYRSEVYNMWVSDLIVTGRDATNQAINTNGGSANYRGVELALKYDLMGFSKSSDANINIDVVYNLMQNKYDEFINDGEDYSSNFVPGAPQQTVTSILSGNYKGLFGNIRYLFVDAYHMRDDNSIKSDAYTTLNASVGYNFRFGNWSFSPRLDYSNIFNEDYASMTLVNASSFGGNAPRYYYPGRPRNGAFSLKVNYQL